MNNITMRHWYPEKSSDILAIIRPHNDTQKLLQNHQLHCNQQCYCTFQYCIGTVIMAVLGLMQVFLWSRQAGNYAFLESRDQCLHGRLGSVASSRPVGESQ